MRMFRIFAANKKVKELEKRIEMLEKQHQEELSVYQLTLLYYIYYANKPFNEETINKLRMLQINEFDVSPVRSKTAYDVKEGIKYVLKISK